MSLSVLAVVILMAAVCLPGVSCFPSKQQDAKNRKILLQQKEELDNLKCEPQTVVVRVLEELEFHDSLVDEDFFPKVVPVKRCSESCSFCGNSAMGIPGGRCQPVPESIEERSVLTYYFKGHKRVFQEVKVTEHTACKCS